MLYKFHNNRMGAAKICKTNSYYSGIFYFCQYLHIGMGILSFGGDVF